MSVMQQALGVVCDTPLLCIGRTSVIEKDNERLRERLLQLKTSRQKPIASSKPATQQPMMSLALQAKSGEQFKTGKRTIPDIEM